MERSPAPLWATFAGAAGGAWSGGVIAASPFTGAVEALALDDANKPTVLDAWTRRVVRPAAIVFIFENGAELRLRYPLAVVARFRRG